MPVALFPTSAPAGDAARAAPATFRPMVRADLPEAAAMFAAVMELGPPGVERGLEDFFARVLFDSPLADPEIPPLVAQDETGRLAGMIGAETRRLRIDDRVIRVACAGFLAVVPEARQGATGVLLLRRLLGGAQDVTVTDTASELVERIWLRLGGSRIEPKGIHWVRVSRPWSIGARPAADRLDRSGGGVLAAIADGLDDAMGRAGRRLLAPPPVETVVEPLTPELFLEHLDAVAEPGVPRPVYDRASLRWLLAAAGGVSARGRLVAHLVRSPRGRVLGWYVYLLRPGWRSEVLQVAARERDVGDVLDHLLHHAHEHGSAALRGRLEPGLTAAVARRRCLLWYRGGALVHGRDRALAARVADEALLTRLDTDWFADVLA